MIQVFKSFTICKRVKLIWTWTIHWTLRWLWWGFVMKHVFVQKPTRIFEDGGLYWFDIFRVRANRSVLRMERERINFEFVALKLRLPVFLTFVEGTGTPGVIPWWCRNSRCSATVGMSLVRQIFSNGNDTFFTGLSMLNDNQTLAIVLYKYTRTRLKALAVQTG